MVNAIKVFADVMDLWKINCSGSKIEKWIKIEGFYLNSLVIFVENKKVYLIFLGFAKDMFKIKFSDSMLVNFQLVLTVRIDSA
jgi:hypothetical protein